MSRMKRASTEKAEARAPLSMTLDGKLFHAFAKGDFGALYEGQLCEKRLSSMSRMGSRTSSSRKSSFAIPMVTKVTHDREAHEKEKEMAKLLARYDPSQKFSVYATSWCEREGTNGKDFYMLEMPHAGVSLQTYGDRLHDKKISGELAQHIYDQVEKAIAHFKDKVHHGDLHAGNIMIQDSEDPEKPMVRLIDFSGEQTELNDEFMLVTTVLQYLVSITNPKSEFAKRSHTVWENKVRELMAKHEISAVTPRKKRQVRNPSNEESSPRYRPRALAFMDSMPSSGKKRQRSKKSSEGRSMVEKRLFEDE